MKRVCRWFAGLHVVTVAVIGASASAQEVTIAPRLRVDDEFRLEVTHVRTNSSRPQQDATSTTAITVRVVSASAEGTTLEWMPGSTTVEGSQLARDPLFLAASNAVSGLILRINLDASGEYRGLANEAEIATKLQAAIDVIVDGLSAKLPPEQRQGFRALIGQVLSSPVVIASATREAQMYFGLNGITVAVGQPVETNIEQPNPLGRGVIPATLSIRAESVTSDSAVLTTTTTYDGASLLRLTRALIEQSGKTVSAEELAKLPPLEMGDEARYVLDRTVGLMRQVNVRRRVSAGANQQLDSWEIRLAQVPQR